MRRRRTVIVLSLLSAAVTAVIALRQTGVVKHLPDPPGEMWSTDEVSTSETGYPLGIPDAPIGLTSIAANVPLAAIGPEDRGESMPIIPIIAFAKSVADSAITLWFNSEMPRKLKKYCPYCLTVSALNIAIVCLQGPEALRAAKTILRKLRDR